MAVLAGPTGFISAIDNGPGVLNPISVSPPSLFQEGALLTAGSVVGDPDGTATITDYQWKKDGVAIAGATSSSYATAIDTQDAGSWTVDVIYVDQEGFIRTLTSAAVVLEQVNNGAGSSTPITTITPAQEGATLSAGSIIGDPDGNGQITGYQWYLEGQVIDGATDATYTVPADALDTATGNYTVKIFYNDGQGYASEVLAAPLAVNRFDNGITSLSPIVPDGPLVQGVTLRAGSLGSDDPEGATTTITGYQWLRDGVAIAGATRDTYTTGITESGFFSVAVTYRDAQGFVQTVSTGAILQPDQGQGRVTAITPAGEAVEGTLLSAGTIVGDPDGNGVILSYQWLKNGLDVAGARERTTVATDAGEWSVAVTYRDTQGYESTVRSASIQVLMLDDGAGVLSPIVSSFAGVVQPGVILSAGAVSNDPDGDRPAPDYQYQWYRNNTLIAGAIGSTYQVLSADAGQNLAVAVTYADGEGWSRTLLSDAVAVNRVFLATQSQAGLQFGKTELGYAFMADGAPPLQVSYQGGFVTASVPGNGWEARALARDGSGYDLYWNNQLSGRYARWDLDAAGAYTAGQLLSSTELLVEENRHQLDIDGNGGVGTGFFTSQALLPGPRLGSTELGYAFEALNGSVHQITFAGQYASASKPGGGWNAVALLADGSGYDLYWQNAQTGASARWDLDDSGAYVGGKLLDSTQLLADETRHAVDIDGDGSIGVSYWGVASAGLLELGSTELGYAFNQLGQGALHVTYRGDFVSELKPGAGWRAIAVAADGQGYDLYWQNAQTGASARWDLDDSGAYVGGRLLSSAALLAEETRHAYDINRDGSIGVVVPAGVSIGGVELSSTQIGYAIRGLTANPVHVSYEGGFASQDMPGAGWRAVAAAQTGEGYDLYWKNTGTGQYARWDLDASGALLRGTLLSTQQLKAEETKYAADIDKDGITGIPFTSVTGVQGIEFGRTQLGYALRDNGANPIHVTYGDTFASAANPGQNWEAIAAVRDGDGFDLYWRNTVNSVYARWDLDTQGAFTGGVGLNSEQLLAEETKHLFDINGNGLTGLYGAV